MNTNVNDTSRLADALEQKPFWLSPEERRLVVAALRENEELRLLLADERAAHRVCAEMRDAAEVNRASNVPSEPKYRCTNWPDCGCGAFCELQHGKPEPGSAATVPSEEEIALRGLVESIVEILDECSHDFHLCEKCGHQDDMATKDSDLYIMLRAAIREQRKSPVSDGEVDRLRGLVQSFREILEECKNDFHSCERCGEEDNDATKHSDLYILLTAALREQDPQSITSG